MDHNFVWQGSSLIIGLKYQNWYKNALDIQFVLMKFDTKRTENKDMGGWNKKAKTIFFEWNKRRMIQIWITENIKMLTKKQ